MARVAFDPFEALGLSRDASGQTIKSTYHALARRYHPNRHQGSEAEKATLSDHFHYVHQAWELLSNADKRRRRAELLDLLELQNEITANYIDLLEPDKPPDGHHLPARQSPDHHSDLDGNVSSDGDDDLPHVGLHRRQTVLDRFRARGKAHLGDNEAAKSPTSPSGSPKRVRISIPASEKPAKLQATDYFTMRRKKLQRLRKKELDTFLDYRDAMVAKFEAEEEAEKQRAEYEQAKWKREYFERAPRETTERLRSFQRFMGAYRTLTEHVPGRNRRSTLSYGIMSPVTGAPENGQFLIPDNALARRKSVHKRAWSTDLTGDQTSSDSDSDHPTASRRISPPGRWNHHMGRARDPTLDTFRQAHVRPLIDSTDDRRERDRDSAEFRLVVRQPTDLNVNSEQDSSPDTSRSPSPRLTCDGHLPFTVVSSTGAAELFGISSDRRPRSLSPAGHHRRHSSRDKNDHESHNNGPELCHFIDKQSPPQHRYVPMSHVHVLNTLEKAWMLGAPPDSDVDPYVLMQRLRQLDPLVAEKYMVKPDIINEFKFRLIYSHRETAKHEHSSFIALSYRRKHHVAKHADRYTLPLDAEIFQAFWDERQSDTEGVWIDQICIDQDSDLERTISMSAMDMVYRSARMIVVALDDIELEAHEGDLLVNHMEEYASMGHVSPGERFRKKQTPYLESHDDLYQVVRKMLRSSWFKRAWCRHEMRLGKQHIFLIPCRRPGFWTGRDVLRFNGKCIAHLLALSTEVPFESAVESVKPALHAFFRDRSKMAAGETEMRSHHGNFSSVVAEVFAMEAGGDPRIPEYQRHSDARKDKISIILNTMECGVALQPKFRNPEQHLSENVCYHDLLLVALAAQDPGSLCSVGRPLPASDFATSWLFVPTVADSGLNNSKTLPRIPEQANFATSTSGPEHYLQLDLKFLNSARAIHPRQDHDPETLDLARRFISHCQERRWGRNRKRYLIDDRKAKYLFGDMLQIYVETLACVLHCGPNWVSDVCQRYSMSRWKVELQGAWELLVAFRNTLGKWPPRAWSERAAGFIMDFVNFLVIRGLPQRQITKPEPWRPIWVPTQPGGHVITFIPLHNKHIRTAVPSVLSHPDYVHLARMWILEPKHIANRDANPSANVLSSNSEWTILGKSVVFSDEISIEQMHNLGGINKSRQRVFGRRLPAANGVVLDGSVVE